MMTNLHLVVFGALINLQGVFMGEYSSSHYLGTHVDLECESETSVDCIWKLNEGAIYIGDNYHYVFSNGSVTTDCSLQISTFHEGDVGNWTCWSLATDENNGQLLNSYQLALKENQMDDAKNSSKFTIAVRNGWALVLACKFDTTLEECHWFRNAEPVFISNRYKFVNFNRTGSDCSINITSVENIDLGSWQCTTSANNIFGYRSSHAAWLISQEPSESQHTVSVNLPTVAQNFVIEHPSFLSANIGDTVNLRCAFGAPVHCVWLRKGRPIHVGHHHYFAGNVTTESKRSNCTLTISHLILNDIGRWTCFGAALDSGYAIKSMSVHITQNQKHEIPFIYAKTRNSESYMALGGNVTIYCTFTSNVYCDWTRNGQSVKISNRYSFVNRADIPSTSCSIKISSVKYFDAGNWSCSYMPTIATPNGRFAAYNTTLYVTSIIILTMNNRELSNQDTILKEDLENDNNILVCTVETRNKPPKLNWRIRDEIIPGDYKYVQIANNVYLGRLYWKANSTINFNQLYYNQRTSFSARITKTLVCELEFSLKRKEIATVKILKEFTSHPVPDSRRLFQTSYMPSIIFLLIGDNVILNCTFNKPVNCSWKLNNTIESNSSIYKYLDASEGQDTTNCSIIVNFNEDMVNSAWQCSNMQVSTNESAKSYPTTLSVMATPTAPVIKWRYQVVNKIFYPEMRRNYDGIILSLPYKLLECSVKLIYPSPTLKWEANGIVIGEEITNQIDLYLRSFKTLESMKNVTELRCVVHYPSLKSPIHVAVELERYKIPTHPVITINGAITKTNITLHVNDLANEIHCVCKNGYPSANLSWILDGQKILQSVDYHEDADFKYTSTLYWQVPTWKLFKKPKQLNCVAEHPGWDKPEVALANITLAYIPIKDHLQLLNENRAMEINDIFIFHCVSSQPINCSMMLNDTIVKEISPVSTALTNDLIEGHILEQCYIQLPPFSMQYVGVWQCTNGIAGEGQIKSNKVSLTPFEIPLKPRIEIVKYDGFYMSEDRDEIILKTIEEKPKLKCVVQRSNPVSTLQWVLNGNNITSNQDITIINTNYYLHDSILRWDSALNFAQANESAILQCIAFFPTSETKFEKAEIVISIQKSPSKPVIFFNNKVVTREVDVPTNFNGFKCISENGNPAAKLHWQVNGQGINGQYKNYLVANSTYTAELQWDPKNDDFLAEGPIKLACVVIHPSLQSSIIHGIQANIKTRKDVGGRITKTTITPLPNQIETTAAFHYFSIALLSTFFIIVAILAGIIYIRTRKKGSSGGSSTMNIGNFFSRIRRKQSKKDSPLIKYEHCYGENECQATIISTHSEN